MYSPETIKEMERKARIREREEKYQDIEIEEWLKLHGRVQGRKVA
jgi:hypothetical protein